ncbi:MAG: polyphosphate kinase 2 family protein [Acidimicrobiales bacterium]
MAARSSSSSSKRWRVRPGRDPGLDAIATDTTDGAPGGGDKTETVKATGELSERLGELQGRLWAEGRRSLLVVLQAMDAAGKDGAVKHVFRGVNPMGVHAVAFTAPTHPELAHDFLWRINRELPERGDIGIFNRSHYEDVLIVRVDELVPESVWRPRFDAIRSFEKHLVSEGTTIVKVYLHISKEEQAKRFRARLEDPAKNWKFAPGDLEVRQRWGDYRAAYTEAIKRTATADAPWYVIPADRKWYRNWAMSTVLVETLERMDPKYPAPAEGLHKIVID